MSPAAPAPSGPVPPAESLRRRADFDALARGGGVRRNRLFTVRARRNGLGSVRSGFAVSRRVGKAVTRNRIRRRLRALMRERPPAGGFDLLVTAHPPAAEASFEELRDALDSAIAGAIARADEAPDDGAADGAGTDADA